MAVTKSDLLQFVAEYQQENKRPCPKATIISTHGEAALDVLKELVADKSVSCRRGRNGGYFPTDTLAALTTPVEDAPNEADNGPSSDEESEIDVDSIAERFRALEARIAAEANDAAADENEQAPF